ncbi:MAG: extracellular solute-binding protein [Candidatus Firestonebacteria bacterium]
MSARTKKLFKKNKLDSHYNPKIFTDTEPLYMQLKKAILEDIKDKKKGYKIPGERGLIDKYKVSITTVRKTISLLEQEGVVIRRHGLGTFVCNSKIPVQGKIFRVHLGMHYTPDKIFHNEVVEQFQKKYNNIKIISAEGLPYDRVDYSDVDVVQYARIFDKNNVQDFLPLNDIYSTKFIENELNIKRFSPKIWNAMKIDGKIYGVPRVYSPLVMFYNKKRFDEEKIKYPSQNWNWNTFMDYTIKLTNVKKGKYGCAMLPYMVNLLPFLWQNNTNFVAEDGTITPDGVEAMKFFIDIFNISPVLPNERWGMFELFDKFIQGEFAMFPWTSSFLCYLKNKAPDKKIGILPLPQKKKKVTLFSIEVYCISKFTKHPKIAFDFVKTLTNSDSQLRLSNLGRFFVADETVLKPDVDEIFSKELKYSKMSSLAGNKQIENIIYNFFMNLHKNKNFDITKECKQLEKELNFVFQLQNNKFKPINFYG